VGIKLGVSVGGNHTTVGVRVSVRNDVEVTVGIVSGPEQAARASPHVARKRFKMRFGRMVSFIVLKTGKIMVQDVVQLNHTSRSA
jgi:hypothetical protein